MGKATEQLEIIIALLVWSVLFFPLVLKTLCVLIGEVISAHEAVTSIHNIWETQAFRWGVYD